MKHTERQQHWDAVYLAKGEQGVRWFEAVPRDLPAHAGGGGAVDGQLRGGTAIIATFAPDGPEKCSGLPVQRYAPRTLAAELGERFALVESASHVHTTPWGSTQSFQYSRLERLP
jgi:hypothetical protein